MAWFFASGSFAKAGGRGNEGGETVYSEFIENAA